LTHAPFNENVIQRKSCACGGGCPRCQAEPPVQTKLNVSTPGDRYEQEADRVAEQVMRMTGPTGGAGLDIAGSLPEPRAQRDAVPESEEEEEETAQAKGAAGHTPRVTSHAQSQIDTLRAGGGRPLPAAEREFFESRFGYNFGGVRVHADTRAAESARSLDALAYTVGRDIVFGAGQYAPGTDGGRRLLAHELTHVVQQAGAGARLQRQWVADTGFRYTPPATVTRSIVEIQGVVGVTPDGAYGENTRRAVERYQTKLKAVGFYSDTLDGKWGDNTETAHVAFATASNAQRKGYNCAGFAFKDYVFRDMASTKAKYAAMTHLASCSDPCNSRDHKFWMWEFDIHVRTDSTGAVTPDWRDFHTVGGQTDDSGNGPAQVMSKDGPRPVRGPSPPLAWKPITEPVLDSNNNVVPDQTWVVSNIQEDCYCNPRLP
jgi:hypothetical protein